MGHRNLPFELAATVASEVFWHDTVSPPSLFCEEISLPLYPKAWIENLPTLEKATLFIGTMPGFSHMDFKGEMRPT